MYKKLHSERTEFEGILRDKDMNVRIVSINIGLYSME